MRRLGVLIAAALALVPADGTGAARVDPPALLARYRPVLVLHPAERFPPIFVEQFLTGARLDRRSAGGWDAAAQATPRTLPTADPPDCRTRPCWRLDVEACAAAAGPQSVACYTRAAPPTHGGVFYGSARRVGPRIVLQYWFFYAYNLWTQVGRDGRLLWRSHEGDWEQVTIVLTRSGSPLYAGYSQHCAGARRPWRRVPRWRGTTRPLVYVALGSHANYFSPGTHAHARRCYPQAALEVFRVNGVVAADVAGRGRTLTPARTKLVRVAARSPTWMAFAGGWGETGYFHAPGIDTIAYGLGPEGPAFHTSWRDPLRELARWPVSP